MTQMCGGDLDGVVNRLDHISDLGISGIYLTPVFPARSNHRYDASSFDYVDPISVVTWRSPACRRPRPPEALGHDRPHPQSHR